MFCNLSVSYVVSLTGVLGWKKMLEKKVITINKNKINIDFSELEKEINNLKISSKELVEVVNVKTTMEPVSNELIIFKDNKCIANYIIESGNKSNFSSLKFLHLCIRILNNFCLMIDGEIDDSPFKTEKKINQIDGIRFQPVLLNAYNNDNPENKGMGLFSRGLHFSGFITPSNFRLCCICDECKKSFNIHSYHAGNGYFQYFYSDDGRETLMVPYDAIKTSEITSNSINVKWEQLVKDRDSLRKMFTDTIGKK